MRYIIVLVIVFLNGLVYSQKPNFKVSGDIVGLKDYSVNISIVDKNTAEGYRNDTFIIKDGHFEYSGFIPEMRIIYFLPKSMPWYGPRFQFVAYPGADIHFSGDFTQGLLNVYPSGDEFNEDLTKLNKELFALKNKMVEKLIHMTKDEVDKVVEDEYDKTEEELFLVKKRFIMEKPSSVISAWLLSEFMIHRKISNENAVAMYDKLDKERLKDNILYQELSQRVEGYFVTKEGNQVPDLVSINTYGGKKFDLSKLRGKYTVLDFWGTWCGPCISGMPKLKEYLDKYKGKLEIVGIANESDDGNHWRSFLDNNPDFHWHHVLSRPDEDFILKFSIAGYPTKILIAPNGQILGRYIGESDDFYKKLDDLMM